MQAFFVSFKYISNLIDRLNLILIIVISASVFNPIPTSASNTTLLFTIFKFYNTA